MPEGKKKEKPTPILEKGGSGSCGEIIRLQKGRGRKQVLGESAYLRCLRGAFEGNQGEEGEGNIY